MSFKFSHRIIVFLSLFTFLLGSSVLADDGRINRTPYHFGGDTLYCNQQDGCTLLNKDGYWLANWPQTDIATAFATTDQLKQNTEVGVGQGTYGPMQLWAVVSEEKNGNSKLCMIGFDEWGKQNDMCFGVTGDYQYEQAPLPVVVPTAKPTEKPIVEPTTATPPVEPPTATPTASPTTATPTVEPTTATPTASPTTATPTASPTTATPCFDC